MRRIFWLLFCLLIGSGAAFGQFPANPNKIRLGNQTTGDGLIYRTDSIPDWTPSDVRSAWIAFDTVAGVLYYYEGGTWNSFTSGGAGIDSIAYAADTLYIYTPSETFKAEIIAGSAPNLTFTNALGPVKLSAGADSVAFDDGTGTNVTQSGGTLYYNLNSIGTPGTYTSVTTDAYGRVTAGTNPGFVTVVDSTRVLSDSIAVYYQNGSEIGRDTIRVPGSGGSGTVTSISQGVGIAATPNPITTTGTIAADTTVLGSKTWTNNQLILKLNISDTAAMLAPYLLGSELLPTWTTAGRPAAPSAGRTGYNTTAGNLDFYGPAAWENPVRSATATGLGTANQIFFADANGRAAGSTKLTWTDASNQLVINSSRSFFSSSVAVIGTAATAILPNNTTGIGSGLFSASTTGAGNIAIGPSAGAGITIGGQNIGIGFSAMSVGPIIGDNNIGIGAQALRRVTGSNNIAIGASAGDLLTSGGNNTLIGAGAGAALTTASNIVAIGQNAANALTTGASNIAIGTNAMALNQTSTSNIAIGSDALDELVSGAGSTVAIGRSALTKQTTGAYNNGLGFLALSALTTGTFHDAVGYAAGSNASTGSRNVFFGYVSGGDVTTGSNGVYIGAFAARDGSADITGSGNIVIGDLAANNMAGAAAKNIVIGENIQLPTANGSSQIVIGNLFFGTGASGTGTTIPAGSKAGIKTATPARDLEVAGEVRITDLTTDTPTRIVGADADGDLGALTLGTGVTIDAGVLNVAASGVSDGDKGDVDVTSSGAVWTVDTNAITTVKISDGAVTSGKLADGAAGGTKLGAVTFLPIDSVDVTLTSYLSIDWIGTYSELHVYMYTGAGATVNQRLTFPQAGSTYSGKRVWVVFDDADGADAARGELYESNGTLRFYGGASTGMEDGTTYVSSPGESSNAVMVVCMQHPRTLAWRWVVYDAQRAGY